MYIDLDMFNNLLKYPASETALTAIRARQSQIVADKSPEVLVLGNAKWDVIRGLVFRNLEPETTLYQYEQKASDKWVGPQGLAGDYIKVSDRLAHYYAESLPFKLTLSPETYIILQNSYRGIVGLSPLVPWKEVLGVTAIPTGTSTGYDGFSSEERLRPLIAREHLDVARAIADGVEIPHPVIAWYRSQRNAYRNIFGAALSTLMAERHLWGRLVNNWIPRIRYNAWRPMTNIQEEVLRSTTLPKRWRPTKYFSFEGDFEMMDTGVVAETSRFVLDVIGDICHWTPSERSRMHRALEIMFTTPLVDYDGQVRIDMHSLFSGMFPTNGWEFHLGIFIMIESFVRACKDCGLPATSLWQDVRFVQQGDDSGLVSPYYQDFPEALRHSYIEVSTEAQQRVNFHKQRISYESMLFCKNELVIPGSSWRNWKQYISSDGRQYPVPRYSLLLTWNSLLNPESPAPLVGPADDWLSWTNRFNAVLSIWDNAYGHPNWAANLAYFVQTLDGEYRRALVSGINDKRISSTLWSGWEKRVMGGRWKQPNAGATAAWIKAHY